MCIHELAVSSNTCISNSIVKHCTQVQTFYYQSTSQHLIVASFKLLEDLEVNPLRPHHFLLPLPKVVLFGRFPFIQPGLPLHHHA